MKRSLMTALFLLMLGGMPAPSLFPQASKRNHNVTKADIDRWKAELSNWGRWGKDDQLGTLNLITPEKRKQAARLVQDGLSVSLARTAMTERAVDNPNPYEVERSAREGSAADRLSVAYHGDTHTHLDALDHVFAYDGKTYNGYALDKDSAVSKTGHTRNNIVNFKNGIITRGILIDIPRLKGVPYLEAGTPIYIEDLEAWEKMSGVKVSAGDALFIRTGRWARRAEVGPWDVHNLRAGLDISVVPWLRQRDIATLGSDVAQSVRPRLPNLGPLGDLHDFTLSVLGIPLFDNCDLEALSQAAAERHRWEFLLMAGPLAIPGGTGSPVNPIAVF